jgi:hypothetical protein
MDEKDTKEKAFGVFDKTVNRLILTRLKNPDEQLDNYEKILMDRLFITGDSIIINNLLWDFVDTFHKMEKNVIQILLERKYYARNPWKQKILLIILAIASCVFTYNFFLTLVILFLSKKLHGRTALGDKIAFNIDELKLFIKSIDENYSLQKDRFNIAEQIIPYAVSLGFIDKYLEQLKIISPDYNPAWLTGNIDVSSLYYFLMACIDSSGGGIRGNAGIYATGESGV